MNRAGREPAEDVKRRIVAACEEAGLEVATARMYLRKQHGDRVVLVAASPDGWRCERSMLTVLTTVKTDGHWAWEVDIRCSASDDDSIMAFWDTPVLRGRGTVPIEMLVEQITETLVEREQVVAAILLGVTGPYTFTSTRWEAPAGLLRA